MACHDTRTDSVGGQCDIGVCLQCVGVDGSTVPDCIYVGIAGLLMAVYVVRTVFETFQMVSSQGGVRNKTDGVDNHIHRIFSFIGDDCLHSVSPLVGGCPFAKVSLNSMFVEILIHVVCEPSVVVAGQRVGGHVE